MANIYILLGYDWDENGTNGQWICGAFHTEQKAIAALEQEWTELELDCDGECCEDCAPQVKTALDSDDEDFVFEKTFGSFGFYITKTRIEGDSD